MESYTVFDFYLGYDEDTAEKSWQIDGLMPCPQVGEKVSLWSTRDERGNYVYKDGEKMFEGIVVRIEHTFEERGNDAQHNHKVHFVEIFMKPIV